MPSKRFECYTCGFTFLRDLSKERRDKPCSKCFTGQVGPKGTKQSEVKQVKL